MQPNETVNLLQKLEPNEIVEIFSEGLFCQHCDDLLKNRLLDLIGRKMSKLALSRSESNTSDEFSSAIESSLSLPENHLETAVSTGQEKASWASYSARCKKSPPSVNSKHHSITNGGHSSVSSVTNKDEENERIRISQVGRKKDFYHIERVNEKSINVLQGLELHTRVFNIDEQKKIVDFVYSLQRDGQNGQLRERTYSEPRKWMRGKGRVTMQFGCCYNYAVDQNGNPPGIIRDEEVDPLPPLFKQMIKRMVKWQVLPSTCVPNSCIVNIYDEGDCIPPHIDHHDFLRPFCTVSFLTECNILFGTNLKIIGPGEFAGPVSIPLPVGSVLILKGNGANIAKHSIPAVPTKRISITFRKMDDSKLPYKFSPDPELTGIKPLGYSSATKSPVQQIHQIQQNQHKEQSSTESGVSSIGNKLLSVEKDEFPPLGSSNSGNRQKNNRIGSRR